MPKALITGITGQDGSYLAEFLLTKGYAVFGMNRRNNTETFEKIQHLIKRIHVVSGDLLDQNSLQQLIEEIKPDEIYNLAAQSFIPASWRQPLLTGEVTALGVTRLLEAIRAVNPGIRLYQASTSEMFGAVSVSPQTEQTPFHPRSPYGVSKVYAYWIMAAYRDRYGLHCSSGILYNHESPRRGLEFVTRKVTRAAALIKAGLMNRLEMGDLEARRDWGFAGDYVRAMWMMLQQEQPGDYVIATGQTHSVRELCEVAFARVGLDYRDHVVVDPSLLRGAEAAQLVGDPTKAKTILGWTPQVGFKEMIEMMVDEDLQNAK
ncbi:MAG: GDP-mannose 4,6-dehydratase [Candidatus Sumerlaeota bacterium]|nr:GDP-mannose 4,6-dehydratase [Candidatus Sumerlaeota bacterium]